MKKIFAAIALILTLAMVLSLSACGGDKPAASQPSAPAPSAPAVSTPAQSTPEVKLPDAYVFQADGKSVAVNADMADVLAALGEPASYFEAESCAFNGLDKTYTYSGFVITTRPDGDKDFVNSILLTDDSVTTPEGIYLGSTKSDVLTAYGSEGNDLGALVTYTKGDCVLNFVFTDDKVISIEYLPVE